MLTYKSFYIHWPKAKPNMNSISYARSPIECSICKPFWHKETEEGHLVHKRCMRKKQYIDVFCLITLEQNNVCPWNINNVNWCYLTLLQWFRVILLQEFRIIWPESVTEDYSEQQTKPLLTFWFWTEFFSPFIPFKRGLTKFTGY